MLASLFSIGEYAMELLNLKKQPKTAKPKLVKKSTSRPEPTKELSTIIKPELYSGIMLRKVGMVSMFKDRQTKRLLTDICGDIIASINCRDIFTAIEYGIIKQSLATLFDRTMQLAITDSKVTRLDLRENILYGVEEIKETMISNLQLIDLE
jgi:hypothetical protein